MTCDHKWTESQFNPKNSYCNKCGSWLLEGNILCNRDNYVEAGRLLIEQWRKKHVDE